MADNGGSAISGGFLVILGILVAVGLGYFFLNGHASAPSGPTISVTVPKE